LKKIILIIVLILTPISVFAYRTSRPIKFTDLTNPSQITQLNEIITELWNISNGRYTMNYVTTNPDGALKGDIGDMVLLKSGGNYYLEVNTTGSNVWLGVVLTNTP
jgi:hypothetical protein